MKIQIFKRTNPNEIIETKEVKNLKSFMYYWLNQCDNKTYNYKIVSEDKI